MSLLKNVLKVAGSAALVATGAASTLARGMMTSTGNDKMADLMGKVQNASLEKVRDIWTPDENKDDVYYAKQAERELKRELAAERYGEQQRQKYQHIKEEQEKLKKQMEK